MSDTVDILNAVKYVNIFQKLPNAINPKTKVKVKYYKYKIVQEGQVLAECKTT